MAHNKGRVVGSENEGSHCFRLILVGFRKLGITLFKATTGRGQEMRDHTALGYYWYGSGNKGSHYFRLLQTTVRDQG